MDDDQSVGKVIRGTEALAAAALTPGQLRWNYRPIFPDVHVPRGGELTLLDRTVGAWLWSRRRAVVTGRAAAALHGSRWVDPLAPIELIALNNRPPPGIISRLERIGQDEVVERNSVAVASVERTAFDLGRFLPRNAAVAHLDALACATGLTADNVLPLATRYRGARGVRRFKTAVDLMDGGAQSPQETRLRLLFIDAGYPRPRTQIPVFDDDGHAFAYLDMGWEDMMISAEYDGEHHRTDPVQYKRDIWRQEKVEHKGWINIRVIAGERPYDILDRLRVAWIRRENEAAAAKRAS